MRKFNLQAFELTQKAYNGGYPLDNETARELNIGHGTTVLIIPTRKFVSLLKGAKNAATQKDPAEFIAAIQALIDEHDKFVVEVRPDGE